MSDELVNQSLEQNNVLKTFVVIGGKEFEITPLNAKKTTFVMNTLGRLLIGGRIKLKEFKGLEAKDLPIAILTAVDEQTLVALAAVVVGCDEDYARDNFNLSWVLEALAIQVQVGELDKVIRNFTLLVSQIA